MRGIEKEKRGKKLERMRRDRTEKGRRKCEDNGENCQRKNQEREKKKEK